MKGDHEADKREEDALLDSDTAHIYISSAFARQHTHNRHTDIQPNLSLARRDISARQHHPTRRLDEKDDDIEPDEPARQRCGADAPDALVRQPEVDDAPDNHVDEGVDPERREKDEHLRGDGPARGARVARTHDAEGEAEGFPGGRHADDPAEGLAVGEGLDVVGEGDGAEEGREGDGAGVRGAVGPLGVGVTGV
jgi:hypothetical protein